MKILITGCCGFIGSNLTERLLSLDHQIIGIDNFNNYYSKDIKLKNIENALTHKNFQFIESDVFDISKLIFDS